MINNVRFVATFEGEIPFNGKDKDAIEFLKELLRKNHFVPLQGDYKQNGDKWEYVLPIIVYEAEA